MKILSVHSTEKIFGGERIPFMLYEGLKNNFDFIFFLPRSPAKDFYPGDFKTYCPEKLAFISVIKKLSKVIATERPTIVHSHGERAGIFVKLSTIFNLFRKKFKFVYTLHGIHFVHKNFLFKYLFLVFERLTNTFVNALVCVGVDDYNLAKRLKLINERKLFLIENGIEVEKFERARKNRNYKKGLGLNDEVVITTISRLHPPKDIETLVKAIKLLEKENVVLLIVGDGPQKKELERLAQKLGIGNKILFLGSKAQEEIFKLLGITDLFVLSTRWEGLPLAVLEAMASKIPVIASNVHGVGCLVKDGENGLLFDAEDDRGLAEKIKFSIGNPALRNKLAKNAHDLVKKRYTKERMLNEYKNLYSKLVKKS